MGKFLRALVVTTLATSAAVFVVAALRQASRDGNDTVPTEPKAETPEVEADKLPKDVRDDLVAELEGHV
ncbi:MAG: hypothetical protein R3282_03380 [Rhodothermales bacterium]|nr:hypothetical protein [Rhodothermales bacterium]